MYDPSQGIGRYANSPKSKAHELGDGGWCYTEVRAHQVEGLEYLSIICMSCPSSRMMSEQKYDPLDIVACQTHPVSTIS